jgi:predicted SprT family Zn-dependent metalloprotease
MNGTKRELKPLPYHERLRDYLHANEKELWDWFASAQAQADYAERLRLELLKTTYRLDPENHGELYRALDQAKARLNLDIPVTLYQAQHSQRLNASLLHLPGEGHIVFYGSILALLNAEEIQSVLGHELAHYHLWNCQEGDFQIADRLLQAIANDPRAGPSHVQTARRFQLYTEIFCDRGSFCVSEDQQPVISSLVKIQTGLPQVSATSYLKQAEEIFSASRVSTEELSHPEAFIRARAVDLWAREHAGTDAAISAMIEGVEVLDELDLVGQQNLTKATRILIEELLRPRWFQTPTVLGHARLFFEGFRPVQTREESLLNDLKFSDPKLQEYLCYLLLDFVVADRELEELPLAAAFELARRLEIETVFEKIAVKELKVKAKELRKLKEQASVLLAKAEAEQ